MSEPTKSGTREIARDAVRARISEVAVDLFDEHGFANVTVEQIATEVGISARSFHRYFAVKEDAVIAEPMGWGVFVRDRFAERPADEPVWEGLLAAYEALLAQPDRDDVRGKRAMRVLGSTPSLRARNLEKHLLWAQLLTPLVAERLRGPQRLLRAEALVHSSLACFDIALGNWAQSEAAADPAALLRTAFAEIAAVS
ncbi:TetR/AcrR family transcriptional regulator [Protaetiibacter mangrovi]|uniref:TetR/AcrR family transcriptional regulator n=1 Tax=Protaetiibacter mangrovi TaxID=2970926 RepID=A0ABT1ZCX8_9MICO|nr:TetR/AcrR family transcriptional regulator [Protaetiibacter mangrovi]MCS0498557.1 TetR/AcrR family transcriptional regulator [Protaetiibacter mangrovi]